MVNSTPVDEISSVIASTGPFTVSTRAGRCNGNRTELRIGFGLSTYRLTRLTWGISVGNLLLCDFLRASLWPAEWRSFPF